MAISELAEQVAMSQRQIERLFKSELSTTPTAYYNDLRLDKARTLIRQTGMGIQEIAVATGYNTASYFTKSFKSRFGHTPKQERENS